MYKLVLLTLFLVGCNCKTSYMSTNYVVQENDKNLNCEQILYAINESEFLLKNVYARCSRPHIFAKFLPCTAAVKLDAARNEYILWDRIDFLKSLYRLKKCSNINYNTTIENQLNKLETIQMGNKIITPLPTN